MNARLLLAGLCISALSSCDRVASLVDIYSPGTTFEVSSTDGKVNIEVWDDECQDGDIIGLSVGSFKRVVELTNRHQIFSVTLPAGEHGLEVLAVNGSGFKGNCDFSDSNTHAIQVWSQSGGQPATYSTFSSRAGTGARHTINLTIP